jgi:antitoxin (DNA-binding transcriptional repressor) of toxin-antitoxin stability system
MGHVSEMVGTMSTKIVTVQEVKDHLLELIGLVEKGEEVVITHDDQPKVKLVPIVKPPQKRVFGQHRGQVWMSPDFDDPLPDDFWLGGSP